MHHIPGFNLASRRRFLEQAGLGCGSLALASLLHSEGVLANESQGTNPLAPAAPRCEVVAAESRGKCSEEAPKAATL